MLSRLFSKWRRARQVRRDRVSLMARTKRWARRVILTVLLFTVLACLACVFAELAVRRVSAHAEDPNLGALPNAAVVNGVPAMAASGHNALDVVLVIDNSNSMFDKHGIGSDPELQRIEAAKLFIHYLGVDNAGADHRLGVISFGGTAECLVPLTQLGTAENRQAIADRIANPTRMAWTDPTVALRLASEILSATDKTRGRVVVLLTDGKPEWPNSDGNVPRDAATVLSELIITGRAYADAGTQLYVALLTNRATDADPEIAGVYVPLWEQMTTATGGQFYAVRTPDALIEVYRDVLLSLNGMASAGAVVRDVVDRPRETYAIPIESDLAQLNLTVWAEASELNRIASADSLAETSSQSDTPSGDLTITLRRPDGQTLTTSDSAVRHTAYESTEIWAIDRPVSGVWNVVIEGQGAVTIWKDTLPSPVTPTPEPTLKPTATPRPTLTEVSTPLPTQTLIPTPTPVLELQVEELPRSALVGTSLMIRARVEPGPARAARLAATWMQDGKLIGRGQLSNSGQLGDRESHDGSYAISLPLERVGTVSIQIDGEAQGVQLMPWRRQINVLPWPRLEIVEPAQATVWRAGDAAELRAEWILGAARLSVPSPLTITSAALPEDRYGLTGRPLTMTIPMERGVYTWTVTSMITMPQGTQVADSVSFQIQVKPPLSPWVSRVALLMMAAAGGGGGIFLWHRSRPTLTGKLQVINQSGAKDGASVIDLSNQRRTSAMLGGQASPLGNTGGKTVWAQLEADGDGRVILKPSPNVEVRLQTMGVTKMVRGQTVLRDQDIITCGDLEIRYDSVEHRQLRNPATGKSSPKGTPSRFSGDVV